MKSKIIHGKDLKLKLMINGQEFAAIDGVDFEVRQRRENTALKGPINMSIPCPWKYGFTEDEGRFIGEKVIKYATWLIEKLNPYAHSIEIKMTQVIDKEQPTYSEVMDALKQAQAAFDCDQKAGSESAIGVMRRIIKRHDNNEQ